MNSAKNLSPERIVEIKAFKNTDFSGCQILTDEELKKLRPWYPEYFKPKKQAVQIRLDADVQAASSDVVQPFFLHSPTEERHVLAWFMGYGKRYQSRINSVHREVMLRSGEG